MELTTVWFALIAILWIGYFCLEGFDFGVGMLMPFLAADDRERRVLINTIGPVWDGNEVWLLVAGGATFAAFPEWYATLFSGFYLPLLLILLALIVRGVAFEYRAKRDDPRWRARWDAAIIVGSWVPALLWGVAFANIVRGVPIDADKEYAGGFFTLLNPYALLGGVDHAAAVPDPRRDVPRAQDRRPDPARGAVAGGPVRDRGRGRHRRLPGLDPGPHRQLAARRCCSRPRRWPWSAGWRRWARPGRAGRSSAPSSRSRSAWPACSSRCSPT